MRLPYSVFRRIPRRALWQLSVHVEFKIDGRSIWVPVLRGLGLENMGLAPNWKTASIAALEGRRTGTFVDVGANLGQTLLDVLVAGIDGPYFGFEPNPTCVAYIEEMIAANRLSNATILSAGLASGAKVVRLYRRTGLGDETDSAASMIPDFRPGRVLGSTCVSVHDFDSVRDAAGIGDVRMVKIDVEGLEHEVIAGMRRTLAERRPPILCEVLLTDSMADIVTHDERNRQMQAILKEYDYRIARILKTPDDRRLLGAEPIDALPSGYWTYENAHLCDYVFYPAEDAEATLRALGA